MEPSLESPIVRKGPILLFDNPRSYFLRMTLEKLSQLVYKTLTHSVCSPDLTPKDFHFSKRLDNFLTQKYSLNFC
uniref:Uncharacterized protein n=1 Tax=Strongyloides venezuelensis TaxID=75913 RepID=A0A0K0G5N4_STRVS